MADPTEPISATSGHPVRQKIVYVLGALLVLAVVTAAALVVADARHRTGEVAADLVIQACGFEYTATYDAHFGQLLTIGVGAGDAPTAAVRRRLLYEAASAAEMAARRVGLGVYLREHGTGGFECPPIPDRLQVHGIDPTDQGPP